MRKLTDHLRTFLVGSETAGMAESLGLLLLRLTVGLSMALHHGRGTLEGFLESPASYPDPLGLGPGLSMGLMVVAELFCALAVAAGFLTRLALVPLVFGLGTAFFVYHASDPFAHKELAFLYLSAFSALLVAGPGRFSLDELLFRARRRGARSLVILLAALIGTPLASSADSRIEGDLPRQGDRPLERIAGIESTYGVLETSDGLRLRTVFTRPEGAEAPLPAILFVQWLSCDSIELPADRQDGWSRMLRRVAAESGLAMMRTEKAGVGDSEGPPCSELDYETELAHHRDALAALRRHPSVEPDRVVVFGASMGATMAPLLAAGEDLAGVVVWGGGAKTWLERILEFERNFRDLTGMAPERSTREMKAISAFLPEYLIRRRSPAEIADDDPELGGAWDLLVGSDGETHYGRPADFHQQAQQQDWLAAWAAVDAPTLVLYGEYDWYESHQGHALIARLVNRDRPGTARFEVIEATDHHFARYPSAGHAALGQGRVIAEGPAVEEILTWLAEVVG